MTASGVSPAYQTAFGREALDSSALPAPTSVQTNCLRMGASQIRVVVPSTIAAQVTTDVHLGEVVIDGRSSVSGSTSCAATCLRRPGHIRTGHG